LVEQYQELYAVRVDSAAVNSACLPMTLQTIILMVAASATLTSCTKCGMHDATAVHNGATATETEGVAMLQFQTMMSKAISGTPNPTSGFWDAEDLVGRPNGGLNLCMADQIASFATARGYDSVTDLGAGSGAYALHLQKYFKDIRCYDGNSAITTTSHGLCSIVDLSLPQQLPASDLLYSLEVGEHIPKPRESNFLQTVAGGGSKAVILSWALPGQSGDGHVNCQPNDYIIGQMQKLSFNFDQSTTTDMRNYLASNSTCTHEINTPNFVKTLMVFMKD